MERGGGALLVRHGIGHHVGNSGFQLAEGFTHFGRIAASQIDLADAIVDQPRKRGIVDSPFDICHADLDETVAAAASGPCRTGLIGA